MELGQARLDVTTRVATIAAPHIARAQDVIRTAGGLSGKIVFDCINPLNSTFSGLDTGDARSAAEQIAAWAPGARVVKIFNSTGAGNMADPKYGGDRATTLFDTRSSCNEPTQNEVVCDPLDVSIPAASATLDTAWRAELAARIGNPSRRSPA